LLAGSLIVFNVIAVGPFLESNAAPHRAAEAFIILWLIALVAGLLPVGWLVWRRPPVPMAVWILAMTLPIASAIGIAVNLFVWAAILSSV
jgi:hypothetical protein